MHPKGYNQVIKAFPADTYSSFDKQLKNADFFLSECVKFIGAEKQANMRIRVPFLDKLSMGYRFDRDREVISLIYLNYAFIILFFAIVLILHLDKEENLPITYRYHAFLLLCILNLWLIRVGCITLVRILILILTPFLFLILPPLAGLFDDEFYFWFPYVPIALSVIPHFILHTYRHRTALLITLGFYLLLTLFIDDFLIYQSDGSEKIIPFVLENRFYYSLIPILIFLFVNLAIGIVFAKNYEYEQIVLRQQDELIQSEKMASLGTLTTGIAQLDKDINEEKKTLLEQIEKIQENSFVGVKRVSDIITSLNFFANPGGAGITDQDLNHLLLRILRHVEKKIPYNISVQKDIPAGMRVRCYKEQLQQAIINIIENAIEVIEAKKYLENKKIVIRASETKKNNIQVTKISISNNGPAIPEKDLKKIFDPFFTLKSDGKGLGMAICYMIIKEHNGWIDVKNRSGLVVFDLFLPRS
jgi:signal transduction histidine kinase